MGRVRFGLWCRSRHGDQNACSIETPHSHSSDPMSGRPRVDPEEKRGPQAMSSAGEAKSSKTLDLNTPNSEEPRLPRATTLALCCIYG
jgi:hypothetical protein